MIIAERKPLPELLEMLAGVERLLVLGCRGCVAVCSAGGDKEVSVLAQALRLGRKLAGGAIEIEGVCIHNEYGAISTDPSGTVSISYEGEISGGSLAIANLYVGFN